MTNAHVPTAGERHVSPFWRHFLQMLAVMMVGMVVSAAIFVSFTGATSWTEVTTQYATRSLLVMAAGMSVPMLAWMLHRGMGSKNSWEMAAAMVIPAVPFLCLVWFGVTESAQCGGYCALSVVSMLALMLYRRDVYSSPM